MEIAGKDVVVRTRTRILDIARNAIDHTGRVTGGDHTLFCSKTKKNSAYPYKSTLGKRVNLLMRGRTAIMVCVVATGFTIPTAASADQEMITIPDGPFQMGSNEDEADEHPAHTVSLAGFLIDRLPVSNAQMARFLNAVGLRNKRNERLYDDQDSDARIHRRGGKWIADSGYEDHPAAEASWFGARDYCAWRGARLPTEAEWEKAARGTDARRYPWGNDVPDPSRARYAASWNATVPADTHPRGASPYGMLEAAGNVWEWVSSAYWPYPWRADDGRENLEADLVRVTRGGGHDSPASEITTTQRGRLLSRNPKAGHHNIGFRCASMLDVKSRLETERG
jgi:iron(II)-dependent oxidoreductase